jgi:proprotein convertase subtilisin/kexin type 5
MTGPLFACLICSSNCNTCLTTSVTCTTCGLLGGLQSYMYSDSVCYVTCPTNTYASLSLVSCVDCDVSCSSCYGSKYKCIDCAASYYRVVGSNACTQSCSLGQYGDTTSKKCTVCPVGCVTCSSASVCSGCTAVAGTQYFLEGTVCVGTCSPGSFGGFDAGAGYAAKCLSCGGNCLTCQGSAGYCLTCSGGNKLVAATHTCESGCPSGQYDMGGSCQMCSNSCLTCSTTASSCISCGLLSGLQGYLHSDNVCYSVCPSGFYGVYTTAYVCMACAESCNGCTLSAIHCVSCKDSTYFWKIGSDECTNDCGSGYYGDTTTGSCTVCPTGCSACSMPGSSVLCSGCQMVAGVSYYLYSSQCYSVCPLTSGTSHGQYPVAASLSCAECNATCQTCKGAAATDCLSCPANAYLIAGTGECNPAGCIDGQYAPGGTYYCLLCDLSCKTCSSATVCTSCGSAVSGTALFLYSGTCIMICPPQFYPNTANSQCGGC